MADSPAFLFYPKDWTNDEAVQLMSLEQEGAYLRLLCHQWLHDSIPADVAKLAAICRVPAARMAKLWCGIEGRFRAVDGDPARLVNGRLARESTRQQQARAERSEAGGKGARARWQSHGSAIDQPMAKNANPLPLPLSVPLTEGSGGGGLVVGQPAAAPPTTTPDEAGRAEVRRLLDRLVELEAGDHATALRAASSMPARKGHKARHATRVEQLSGGWLATTLDVLGGAVERAETARADVARFAESQRRLLADGDWYAAHGSVEQAARTAVDWAAGRADDMSAFGSVRQWLREHRAPHGPRVFVMRAAAELLRAQGHEDDETPEQRLERAKAEQAAEAAGGSES